MAACTLHGSEELPPDVASSTAQPSTLNEAGLAETSPPVSRTPLPAPTLVLSPAERAFFHILPIRTKAIPVLLFHAICPAACGPADTYGVTQQEFTRILLAAESAGYRTISIANYVKAMQGDWGTLPPRPLLVTFDDGRLDGYRGADDVLRMLGERAVMYVITASADANSAFAMRWSEILSAQSSSRWDMQLHAHAGHTRVSVQEPADGGLPDAAVVGPFYAWRRWQPGTPVQSAHAESFAEWKVRAESDITTGSERLVAELGPSPERSLSFAVPFGDYGQVHSNDVGIAPSLRSFLDAHFPVWFTQPHADPDFTTTLSASHEAFRYTIVRSTTAETVYSWLARHAAPNK